MHYQLGLHIQCQSDTEEIAYVTIVDGYDEYYRFETAEDLARCIERLGRLGFDVKHLATRIRKGVSSDRAALRNEEERIAAMLKEEEEPEKNRDSA